MDNVKIIHVYNAKEFIGVKINDNQVDVYVPSAFHVSDDKSEYRHNLLLLLKSICLAKTIDKIQPESSNKDDSGEVWSIDSFMWIIHDYIENGYYFSREKKYSNDGKGKIDWKRTLKTIPIYANNSFIYDKIVTSRTTPSNDIVTEIYKLCLSYSIKRIGWLFNYHIYVEVNQLKSIREMIYIVKKELNSTFDDIKRLRFKHMLKILEGIHDENALSSYCTYGITNYYYVFEVMVDSFFKGIPSKEKSKYYPGGYWNLEFNDDTDSSKLMPDTIHIHDDKTYIIDAKMYQYGVTKNALDLPSTSSMQKQITYGDYVINCIDKNAKVRNVFILPYNKFGNTFNITQGDRNLVYIGKAYVDWKDKMRDHDYIYSFLIDYNYLLNNYNHGDDKYIIQLFDKVEDIIKNIWVSSV